MARGEVDGGWAWAIVIGVTVINLAVLPVQQCFGLIFTERFNSLGIAATQTSLILHLNGSICCSLGLISGPMMKRFTFRKVACFGSLLVVLGICATAFAMSLPTLIITYCIIIGVGQGIIFPATSLALNTYFREKRNIAMGFTITLTGLGPILMPLLIDVFLANYATTGTLLILSGIATHSFAGASLLKPFEERKQRIISADQIAEMPKKRDNERIETPYAKDETNLEDTAAHDRLLIKANSEERKRSDNLVKSREAETESVSILQKVVKNLDLDLLHDNRYIAIVLGMGISLVAETNFNSLIPFVLTELANLDRTSIATVMSIQAAADITGRLCVPLLAQKASWNCRNLYVISLLGSTVGRTILSQWGDYYGVVIGVSLIVGLAKGIKAVFQALIIPNYVPLERLPAASGIQMVCNGILSITVGPIIGVVHDVTESYVGALHFTSILSMSCVVLWVLSGLWTSRKKVLNSNQESPLEQQENPPQLSTIPVMQGFGLVFKDSFVALNLNATDTSIIVNVNFAFGMILGFMNGPLLKSFGYRKVAIVGSLLYTFGLILMAFAKSFTFIIVSYGLLASLGMGMSMSAFSFALNSYFTKNRSRAMGLAITIMGLGPIFMPQVVSFSLSFYGIQGTILIFGAYSLHSLVGAMLLQPLKWHMKSEPLCLETKSPDVLNNKEEDTSSFNAEDEVLSAKPTINYQRKRKTTISSIDHDVEVGSIYGFDTPLLRQTSMEVNANANYDMEMTIFSESSTNLHDSRRYLKYPLNSLGSAQSINLSSSFKIFDEFAPKKLTFVEENTNGNHQKVAANNSLLEKKVDNRAEKIHEDNTYDRKSAICRYLHSLASVYDLDLLRDPIYVNMMLGMSIAIFAEANFSLLTPFILDDMNMTTQQIATAMSVIAATDLVSRGAAPYLGEYLHQPPRMMYLFSLCLLIISRTSLIFSNSVTSLMIIAVGLGVSKGIRSVYMALVIPSYVPIKKLPSASGIQMMTNGIILTFAGPLIGVIRDNTGSYIPCIILINCVTALTVFIWLVELIIVRRRPTMLPAKS